MPSTASSASSSATRRSSSSSVVVAGSRWSRPIIPTSFDIFSLLRVYTRLAGSSPQRTTARPGGRPCAAAKRATSAFTPSRTVWLMALPSIVRAVMAAELNPEPRGAPAPRP